MKTTTEKIENRQAFLTIELEPKEVEDGLTEAYKRLVKKANIPGFRKGKAPRALLENFIGKDALLDEAVEHMASEYYEKAVREQDLKPAAPGQLEVEKREPVTYKAVVPLEPIVNLGDYHQVKVAPESIELKEEDVDKSIEQLRHQHSLWEPVDRQVNSRDLINLEIESHVGEQPFINQKDAEYQVIKEQDFPVKGFSEELIGMKKGETREFKLSFPEDHPRAELAGKEVDFKVTIKEIKQERLPEVNDEFARVVNPEFQTLDDLKNKIRENLKRMAEEKAQKDFEQKVIDEVVKLSSVEYPPVLVENEVDALIRDQMRRWQVDEQGMDEYLKSLNQTVDELRDSLRPVAIRTLTQSLVMTEVAKQENIEVSPEDVGAEIEELTKGISEERKDTLVQFLSQPQSQMNLASRVATRKIIARLVEIANPPAGTEPKAEGEAAVEAAEPAAAENTPAEASTENEPKIEGDEAKPAEEPKKEA